MIDVLPQVLVEQYLARTADNPRIDLIVWLSVRANCHTPKNPIRMDEAVCIAQNLTIQLAVAKQACLQDRPDPPLGCNRWLVGGLRLVM